MKCCRIHKANCNVEKPVDVTSNRKKYDTVISPFRKSPRSSIVLNEEDMEGEEGWILTPSMENSMKNSDWLKEELKDGGLRRMIQDILNSEGGFLGRSEALKEAKQKNQCFSYFVDKMLLLTGILTEQESGDIFKSNEKVFLTPVYKTLKKDESIVNKDEICKKISSDSSISSTSDESCSTSVSSTSDESSI